MLWKWYIIICNDVIIWVICFKFISNLIYGELLIGLCDVFCWLDLFGWLYVDRVILLIFRLISVIVLCGSKVIVRWKLFENIFEFIYYRNYEVLLSSEGIV